MRRDQYPAPGTESTLQGRVPHVNNHDQHELWEEHINPLILPSEIVVWIYDTFDDNFEIENSFTKYLKESCSWSSDWHFSIKYFPDFA